MPKSAWLSSSPFKTEDITLDVLGSAGLAIINSPLVCYVRQERKVPLRPQTYRLSELKQRQVPGEPSSTSVSQSIAP